MDYAITIGDNLAGAMNFTPAEGISNNVFLSLAVERGSFFHRPEFGLRRRYRLKNTDTTAALIRHDYREALLWLVETGRASSVQVDVSRDRSIDLGRLSILVTVVQLNGTPLTFQFFREVI